jgi:prefoldin subunit 5
MTIPQIEKELSALDSRIYELTQAVKVLTENLNSLRQQLDVMEPPQLSQPCEPLPRRC